MLKAIKSFLGIGETKPEEPKPEEPPLTLQPKPIEINPGSAKTLARHIGRLANLYNVKQRGDKRPEVAKEIEQRKAAIAAYGHKAPTNEKEARELLAKFEEA